MTRAQRVTKREGEDGTADIGLPIDGLQRSNELDVVSLRPLFGDFGSSDERY